MESSLDPVCLDSKCSGCARQTNADFSSGSQNRVPKYSKSRHRSRTCLPLFRRGARYISFLIHVISDSVIPDSVIPDSRLITLALCPIPVSCYSVIPLSVIPDSCFVIPNSVIPDSVIPDSNFARYTRLRYDRFPQAVVASKFN